jgi:hypothetical protein
MNEIQRHPVVSSDIASIGYDAARQTLEIEFHATGVYRYFSVPKEIFDSLLTTTSPGKYFLQNIKTKFAWEKVAPK